MITHTEIPQTALEDVEAVISTAMDRVKAQKATDLCQYLPGAKGCLHHFAFAKLKKSHPEALSKMIKENILDKDSLEHLTPKSRVVPGLMVKRAVNVNLKRSEINQLLNILKNSGEDVSGLENLISQLSPHQTLSQVRKLMLNMVREKGTDQDLWNTYVKLVEEERAILQRQ